MKKLELKAGKHTNAASNTNASGKKQGKRGENSSSDSDSDSNSDDTVLSVEADRSSKKKKYNMLKQSSTSINTKPSINNDSDSEDLFEVKKPDGMQLHDDDDTGANEELLSMQMRQKLANKAKTKLKITQDGEARLNPLLKSNKIKFSADSDSDDAHANDDDQQHAIDDTKAAKHVATNNSNNSISSSDVNSRIQAHYDAIKQQLAQTRHDDNLREQQRIRDKHVEQKKKVRAQRTAAAADDDGEDDNDDGGGVVLANAVEDTAYYSHSDDSDNNNNFDSDGSSSDNDNVVRKRKFTTAGNEVEGTNTRTHKKAKDTIDSTMSAAELQRQEELILKMIG